MLRTVETSPLNPILDCILLSVRDKELELLGTDGQVQVSTTVAITAGKGKEASVPFAVKAKKLNDIVQNMAGDGIQFKRESGNLLIENKVGGRFKLGIRDGGEFPRIEATGGEILEYEMDEGRLHLILNSIHKAISGHEHRIYLSGAFFDFLDDGLHLVATDGHRLATGVLAPAVPAGANFILPRKAVGELHRLLDPAAEGTLKLTARKEGGTYRMASFRTKQLELSCLLINGQYPNYGRVIPSEKNNKVHCLFERDKLLDGVRQVCTVHDKAGDSVRLSFSGTGQKVELSAEGSNSHDEAQVEVPVETAATTKFSCNLNSTYLQDLLVAFEGHQHIKMAFKDGQASVLCVPAKTTESKLQYVVMPVR